MSRRLVRPLVLPLLAALMLLAPRPAVACEGAVAACGTVSDGAFELIANGRADYALDIHLVPTLDTVGRGGRRFGLQVDDGPVEIVTFELEPTGGGPDTPAMQAWYDAVIANRVEVARDIGRLGRGEHRLRFYRIDDNVMPQVFLLRPR